MPFSTLTRSRSAALRFVEDHLVEDHLVEDHLVLRTEADIHHGLVQVLVLALKQARELGYVVVPRGPGDLKARLKRVEVHGKRLVRGVLDVRHLDAEFIHELVVCNHVHVPGIVVGVLLLGLGQEVEELLEILRGGGRGAELRDGLVHVRYEVVVPLIREAGQQPADLVHAALGRGQEGGLELLTVHAHDAEVVADLLVLDHLQLPLVLLDVLPEVLQRAGALEVLLLHASGTDPLVDEVHLTERLEGLLEGLRVPERQIQGVVHLLHQLVVLLVEDELRDGRPCIHLDTVHVLDNLRVGQQPHHALHHVQEAPDDLGHLRLEVLR